MEIKPHSSSLSVNTQKPLAGEVSQKGGDYSQMRAEKCLDNAGQGYLDAIILFF